MNNSNLHIKSITPLLSPEQVTKQLPITNEISSHVQASRQAIQNIIRGQEKRLIAIIGPCSIHNENAAIDYAQRLKPLADQYKEEMIVMMRVYFEKPRTNIGWKGFINDPYLNQSNAINEGIQKARQLLIDINQIGLPTATEFVDTITPQYIADLVAWSAIGARTTESQSHRMLASGLSMPVGFKNNTAGDIHSAVNAVIAASHPHCFLGVNEQGAGSIVKTLGNPDCHVILRGGSRGPNYDQKTIETTARLLEHHHLRNKIIIDCSHDNCNKDYQKQSTVINQLCTQLDNGNPYILGMMLESNLVAGKQTLNDPNELTYGQSITDGCIDLKDTEKCFDHT